jgi:homopolymeric O-antigen transport system ATP-binding protein
MSSELAIEAHGLGKRYLLGERGRSPLRRNREELWALRDVELRVERGNAVGVVGHNGAGKTTLLKILSRITAPSTGEARIKGHVGSLLEVGTGFHPELSGRDNVYLNGAILGMRRREIKAKFDEIVAFAEVERFIDTPVKRYSSGMYVRLAFAVAAHLEPDILIVDEVLAVGDASFQRKCLGKMGEVSDEGRTVLFVSHNMAAVRSLTSKAIWVDHGRVAADGSTGDVVSEYLASTIDEEMSGVVDLTENASRGTVRKFTAQRVRFSSVSLLDPDDRPARAFGEGAPLRIDLRFDVREPVRFLELYVRVKSIEGQRLFASYAGQVESTIYPGRYRSICEIPENPLRPGRYVIELVARAADPEDIVPTAVVFAVEAGHLEEENLRYTTRADGMIRVRSSWSAFERDDSPASELEREPRLVGP